MSARLFDSNQLVYNHFIDLSTKKYVSTAEFPCLEVRWVFGHFSFTFSGEFVCGRQSVKRSWLTCMRSAALIRVNSSCGYKVSNRAFRSLFVLRLMFKNLGIHFCSFSLTPRV